MTKEPVVELIPVTEYTKGELKYSFGYWYFTPSSIDHVQQYEFWIRFTAKGGSIGWTDKLNLNVGCGPWIKIIPAGNFTKKMKLWVDDVATYPIAEFETDTPHCPVENFIITGNKPEGTIKYPSDACAGQEGTCLLADINTKSEAKI